MNFRPCIDIHCGKVKQIVGSTLSDDKNCPVTNFETDLSPAYYADIYKSDDLMGGHVIMLGKGNESVAIKALNSFPGGLQIGGGINPENAQKYLDAGASHVIVTSYVFKDGLIQWDKLDLLKKTVGKKQLVLDLSCKKRDGKYYVVTDLWQNFTDMPIDAKSFDSLADYCDEFLIHASDVEGKKDGIDQELVKIIGEFSPNPVTYAGGVRSIQDLELIKIYGQNRVDVTVGSALDLFGGSLKYREIVEWVRLNR